MVSFNRSRENLRKLPLTENPLAIFIGEWRGQGISYGAHGSIPQMTISKDTYEWLPGNRFLIHRWNWNYGKSYFQGLEMLGWDLEKNEYFASRFDNSGYHINYQLCERNGVWSYVGPLQTAKILMSAGGQKMSCQWKQSTDGISWNRECEIMWDKVFC